MSAWGLTLGLYALDLLPYAPIGADTWLLLGGTIAALVAGAALGQGLVARRTAAPAPPPPVHAPLAVIVVSLLGLAGVAWYVWAVVSVGGWDLFRRGEDLRYLLNVRTIPSRYLFLQHCCSSAALLACAFALAGVRLGVVATTAAILAAAGTLTSTDRTQIFMLVLSVLFMYFVRWGPALRLRRLVTVGVAAPLVLGLAFFTIGAWTGKSAGNVGLRLRIPDGTPGTWTGQASETLQRGSVVYFYATGSYPALAQLLHAGHPRTGGKHTFYPVLRLLQRSGMLAIDLPEAIPPFVPVVTRADGVPVATNAYTFLYYPLEDFGATGALVYAGLVGALCGAVFGWARRDRTSPLRLVVIGLVSTGLALTFFVNKFNSTNFGYVLGWTVLPFVLVALWRRMRRRRAAAA